MIFEPGKVYSHRRMVDTKIYVKDTYTQMESEYLRVIWLTWQGHILADDEFLVPSGKEREFWYEV